MLNKQQARQLRCLISDTGSASLEAAEKTGTPDFKAAYEKAKALTEQLETYLQHLTIKD